MSQQNSEKRIEEDSTDIEFGEFQSPKIKRIPTKYVNPTPIKSPFKRKIALDDIDEDLPQSIKKEINTVSKIYDVGDDSDDDIDDDIDIIEPVIENKPIVVQAERGKNGKELEKTRWCFTYNNPKCTGEEFKSFLRQNFPKKIKWQKSFFYTKGPATLLTDKLKFGYLMEMP